MPDPTTGVLELEPAPGYALWVRLEPNVYLEGVSPRPFAIDVQSAAATGCPPSWTLPRDPSAPSWQSPSYQPALGVRELVVRDAKLDVVYDHPGWVDARTATRLRLARSRVEYSTSSEQRAPTAGRDPAATLTMTALDATSIDTTGDGLADIVFDDPAGSSLLLIGTPRADTVDLARLDPRICVTARLLAGNDSWRAREETTPAQTGCDQRIDVGDGDDAFVGGAGADHVLDGRGLQRFVLGAGDDIVERDWRINTTARPRLAPGVGLSTVDAGPGDDQIDSPFGDHHVDAGPGDDTVTTGNGRDVVILGPGDDVAATWGGDDRAFGGPGDDSISDENASWLPPAYRGTDLLLGVDGNDYLHSNFGRDRLFGGAGNDVLHSRGSSPLLDGGAGMDVVSTYHGSPKIKGGAGRDFINAARMLRGSTLDAGPGNDVVMATTDPPRLMSIRSRCGAGDDRLVWGTSTSSSSCERIYWCGPDSHLRQCGALPWGDRRRDVFDPPMRLIGPN